MERSCAQQGGRFGWGRHALLLANIGFPASVLASGLAPWALAVEAGLAGALFYALVVPRCGWLGPVVTRFRPEGKEVWLTLDDGPFGEATLRLGEALRERGVAATFFCVGRRLEGQEEVGRRLLAWGHALGNHTFSHPAACFPWLLPWRLGREIDRCAEAIARAGGGTGFFRSPVGLKHPWLHRALARRGLRLVAWSVRGRDGLRCEPGAVLARLRGRVLPGDILLLHEGLPGSGEAVLAVVDHLLDEGFRFVLPGEGRLA